jgi:hypothetical protein
MDALIKQKEARMNRLIVLLVAVAASAILFTGTATATTPQPPISPRCSDWYSTPDGDRVMTAGRRLK